MLDFVPNHTALDHPWVEDHPEYYVAGTEVDLAREPRNRQAGGGRAAAGPWPRSEFSRLAGHAAARLQQAEQVTHVP
jgi:glycosidase